MEALLVDEIPMGREWQYEPKWDGFRCLALRDGDSVDLQSKCGQPLARYFSRARRALQIEYTISPGAASGTERSCCVTVPTIRRASAG
jgi:ATP-dependent DNA ligase